METAPCPVLMISTEPSRVQKPRCALDLEAADFIAKTTDLAKLDMAWIEKNLIEKVRYWAGQNWLRQRVCKPPDDSLLRRASPVEDIPEFVVVAASTGGRRAVTELVGGLRGLECPVIVAQHMPKGFTADFALHLALRSGRDVVEGSDGETLQPGRVTMLPGGVDSRVCRGQEGRLQLAVGQGSSGVVYPCADFLLESVTEVSRLAVGIVLIGMDNDGT